MMRVGSTLANKIVVPDNKIDVFDNLIKDNRKPPSLSGVNKIRYNWNCRT